MFDLVGSFETGSQTVKTQHYGTLSIIIKSISSFMLLDERIN